MNGIIFISGPRGSGKTTFANALTRHLAKKNHIAKRKSNHIWSCSQIDLNRYLMK